MPALASQPLEALRSTLIAYTEKTGRRPSLEFAPIAGVNDTARETAALIAFARGMLCHVNLIPLNPLGKEPTVIPTMQGVVLSASDAIGTIAAQLRKAGIECTIRNSRGSDIEGACGQLKSSVDLVVC
jgi:23S rRNA (adenine2503-C2)-methyltransferase